YSMDAKEWTQLAETVPVNELSSDIMGGLEFYCDSGTRIISTAGFANVENVTIDALPIKEPVVPAAPTPKPAPTPAPTPAPVVQTPTLQPESRPVAYQPNTAYQTGRTIGAIIQGLFCPCIFFVVILSVVLIRPFNRLVALRNGTLKAWSDIDIQLKRRH